MTVLPPASKSGAPRNTSLPGKINPDVRNGSVLVGDDFTDEQLSIWFAQEKEAFYHDDAGNSNSDPWYAYMRSVNEILGFSRIVPASDGDKSILILGPGSGIEIEQFAINNPKWLLCFLEASDNFKVELQSKFLGSKIIEPKISGKIELADNSQDAICAFSVLHHIPNVSSVLGEAYRILKPGGKLLIREPCSSMGDWRYARSATPNERGISRKYLSATARQWGFDIEMRPVPVLLTSLNPLIKRIGAGSSKINYLIYIFDRIISWSASWNDHYWRDTWYKKIGPSAYFYCFSKSVHR